MKKTSPTLIGSVGNLKTEIRKFLNEVKAAYSPTAIRVVDYMSAAIRNPSKGFMHGAWQATKCLFDFRTNT